MRYTPPLPPLSHLSTSVGVVMLEPEERAAHSWNLSCAPRPKEAPTLLKNSETLALKTIKPNYKSWSQPEKTLLGEWSLVSQCQQEEHRQLHNPKGCWGGWDSLGASDRVLSDNAALSSEAAHTTVPSPSSLIWLLSLSSLTPHPHPTPTHEFCPPVSQCHAPNSTHLSLK